MAEYDNTNTGALFPAENMKVIRQGKIDIEGKEDDYCLCQVQTKNGHTIFEVYQKVGAVFINERKRDEKDADMSGTVTIEGTDYMMWGRKRESKSGMAFTAISCAVKTSSAGASGKTSGSQYAEDYKDKNPAQGSGTPDGFNDDFSDDIPF